MIVIEMSLVQTMTIMSTDQTVQLGMNLNIFYVKSYGYCLHSCYLPRSIVLAILFTFLFPIIVRHTQIQ